MKRPFAVLLTAVALFAHVASHAQRHLIPADIKSIVLTTGESSLGGSIGYRLEVIKDGVNWSSYQIMRDWYSTDAGVEPNSTDRTRKHIATLTAQQVDGLVESIAVIKPHLNTEAFGLTAASMIADLKREAKDIAQDPSQLQQAITPRALKEAFEVIFRDANVMDVGSYCSICIHTEKDSIFLETNHLKTTKLPWTINGTDTWDMGINNFFFAAMGTQKYPNRDDMDLTGLKEAIYKFIDDKYTSKPIGTYRWNYDAPENLKLLAVHFKYSVTPRYAHEVYLSLKNSLMPANANLECTLDIRDTKALQALIIYNEKLERYLKAGNFVFKYYGERPGCHINFAFYPQNSEKGVYMVDIKKKFPLLKDADPTTAIMFWASAPDDTSNWMLLPNNKLLLIYHSVTTADNKTAPIFPSLDANANWITRSYTQILFNTDGTVIK